MSNSPVKFIKDYKRSLIITLLYVILLPYPLLIAILNQPPKQVDLDKVDIQIIHASSKHPNLVATIDHKSTVDLDFPSSSYNIIKGFGGISVSDDDIEKLDHGCTGNARIDQIKFIPFSSYFRIWELECGDVRMAYKTEVEFYKSTLLCGIIISIPLHLLMFFVIGLYIYGDRKKKWASQ